MMPILQCTGLCKQYGAFPALNGLTLSIMPGRIVGLLGPNGSGKSTLIKLANGLLTPTAGEVRIDGMLPGPETKRIVSYLPERTYLSRWSASRTRSSFSRIFTTISAPSAPKRCCAVCRSTRKRRSAP